MKNLFKVAFAAAALLLGSAVYAQELKVVDFRLDRKDRTACRKATAKRDANGKKCAVIKIVDGTVTSYQSENAAAVATQPTLIYVSAKDKSVVVADSLLGATLEYEFVEPLKPAKTYVMEIERVQAEEPVPPTVLPQQFVLFTVHPENAVIELGTETLTARGGEAQKLLNVGTYKYKVSAKEFYPTEGEFVLTDTAKVEIPVELREANGWIEILDKDEEITGASVYIDDEFVGTAPLVYGKLLAGEHKIMIAKEQYSNCIDNVFVADNDTLTICPCLQPNFTVVTIKTADFADIWANGEKLGTGEWTGKLAPGVYDFEARQTGYISSIITEEFELTAEGVEYTIPDPQPLIGSIAITSFPAKATVYVNGELVGETPIYLPKKLYGSYEIKVEKEGFEPVCDVQEMDQAKRIVVDYELNPACCKKAAEECAAPAEECCKAECTEEVAVCCKEAAAEECCKKAAEECAAATECAEKVAECCKKAAEECAAPAEECCKKVAEECAAAEECCKKAAEECVAAEECCKKVAATECAEKVAECCKAEKAECPEAKKCPEAKAECAEAKKECCAASKLECCGKPEECKECAGPKDDCCDQPKCCKAEKPECTEAKECKECPEAKECTEEKKCPDCPEETPAEEPVETPAEPTETPAEPTETPAEPTETPAEPTEPAE